MKKTNYRHTKIIFTIGPATLEKDVLEKMLEQGVDVCRFNMAHADHAWVEDAIKRINIATEKSGRSIALLMDIKGPEIRTGALEKSIYLERDEVFDLFLDSKKEPVRESIRGVSLNYPKIHNDLNKGDTILVDSGLLRLRVDEVMEDRIRCSVRIGGELGSRRHINLPGIKVNLPALTQKDKDDIDFGVENGIDFFALSFVREPEDLDLLHHYLREKKSKAHVIAKIEDQSAISNLDDIIRASDGLMVARGDLGIEIPYETLPLVQRRAVRTCQKMGKPVIVATHMLESMINNPMPTRAEITDVANAVFEQADCVMLSGETTVGKYPVKCVETLKKIILSVEKNSERKLNDEIILKSPKAIMLKSAVYLSDELKGAPLLVFTRSGDLARKLSAIRPKKSPIFAFTDVKEVFQNLLLFWGVEPFLIDFNEENPEETILQSFDLLKKKGWAKTDDQIVIITNVLAGQKVVDTIQFRIVE